uniref:Gnk2-homologous domain-containing protein n=2 Tax=Chenopodium quinoa TaxID=63459 RepID=A0A803L540_CHEQI
MAARIQLSGCHVQYEADGYTGILSLDDELNHKKCGENQAVVSSGYFEQMRSKAFEVLETEAAEDEGKNGFYSMNNHEGFHAMAQCEAGLNGCDCAKCIVEGVDVVEKECVNSIYGQIFLGLCYLSYEFNPHEFHGDGGQNNGRNGIGKIAAIAIGGVGLLFFVFTLFRCLKKKDDDI